MRRAWLVIIDDAEKEWVVSRRLSTLLFLAPFLALAIAVVIRVLDRPRWSWYWHESGPVEWLQFFMLAVAVVFSLLIVMQLRGNQSILAVLYLVFAAGLLFVAGEEIAWGQTLLHYQTPAELAATNYKGEMSLHNISTLINSFDIGKLLIGLYGSLAALGSLWLRKRRNLIIPKILAPPLFLVSPFLFVVAFRSLRFTVLREDVPVGFGEYEELCLYFGLMAFTWLVWRRHRLNGLGDSEPLRAVG